MDIFFGILFLIFLFVMATTFSSKGQARAAELKAANERHSAAIAERVKEIGPINFEFSCLLEVAAEYRGNMSNFASLGPARVYASSAEVVIFFGASEPIRFLIDEVAHCSFSSLDAPYIMNLNLAAIAANAIAAKEAEKQSFVGIAVSKGEGKQELIKLRSIPENFNVGAFVDLLNG